MKGVKFDFSRTLRSVMIVVLLGILVAAVQVNEISTSSGDLVLNSSTGNVIVVGNLNASGNQITGVLKSNGSTLLTGNWQTGARNIFVTGGNGTVVNPWVSGSVSFQRAEDIAYDHVHLDSDGLFIGQGSYGINSVGVQFDHAYFTTYSKSYQFLHGEGDTLYFQGLADNATYATTAGTATTFDGESDFGALGQDIIPSADNSINLGSSSKRWANTNTVNVTASNIIGDPSTQNWSITTGALNGRMRLVSGGVTTHAFELFPDITGSDKPIDLMFYYNGSVPVDARIYLRATATGLDYVGTLASQKVLYPHTTNAYDLGSINAIWNQVYSNEFDVQATAGGSSALRFTNSTANQVFHIAYDEPTKTWYFSQTGVADIWTYAENAANVIFSKYVQSPRFYFDATHYLHLTGDKLYFYNSTSDNLVSN